VDLDNIRAFCLSFPHATEKLQWGDELCFKVSGKIFAMLGLGSVPQRLTFKCSPEDFADLTERDGIAPAAYVGRYKWVTLSNLGVLTDDELQDSVSKSYGMVAAKAKVKAGGKRSIRRKRKLRAA
jgi:predicted DNA-binding protein (MmcQ/YjbR family)